MIVLTDAYFCPSSSAIFVLTLFTSAATLNECDLVGGFSSSFATPTDVALGNLQVDGTLAASDFDFIQFTSLAAGAQSLSFTFALNNPDVGAFLQNADGEVRAIETQPAFAFDGTRMNPNASPNDFVLSFNLFNLASDVLTSALISRVGLPGEIYHVRSYKHLQA